MVAPPPPFFFATPTYTYTQFPPYPTESLPRAALGALQDPGPLRNGGPQPRHGEKSLLPAGAYACVCLYMCVCDMERGVFKKGACLSTNKTTNQTPQRDADIPPTHTHTAHIYNNKTNNTHTALGGDAQHLPQARHPPGV